MLPLTTEVSLKPRLQWHHHLIEIQYWVCATLLDRMEGPLDKVPEKPNVSAAAKELICADVTVRGNIFYFFSLFPGYICQTGFSENQQRQQLFSLLIHLMIMSTINRLIIASPGRQEQTEKADNVARRKKTGKRGAH